MKSLIVYDSLYGHTEQIARAIGESIKGDIKVLNVTEADPAEAGRGPGEHRPEPADRMETTARLRLLPAAPGKGRRPESSEKPAENYTEAAAVAAGTPVLSED